MAWGNIEGIDVGEGFKYVPASAKGYGENGRTEVSKAFGHRPASRSGHAITERHWKGSVLRVNIQTS